MMALAAPAPTAPGLATGAPVHPSAIADGSQQALTHAIISVVPVANNVKKRPHWNAVGVTERAEMTRVLEGSAEIKVLKKNGSVVQVQDNARALGFVPANGSSFPAFATLDGARKTGAALAGLAKQSAAVGAWPVLASREGDRPGSAPNQNPVLVTAGAEGARVWDEGLGRMVWVRDPRVARAALERERNVSAVLRQQLQLQHAAGVAAAGAAAANTTDVFEGGVFPVLADMLSAAFNVKFHRQIAGSRALMIGLVSELCFHLNGIKMRTVQPLRAFASLLPPPPRARLPGAVGC